MASRSVKDHAKELDDRLPVHAAPESEAPPAGSSQHQLEDAPALRAPDGQHVGVVHARGHRGRARPETSWAGPVAD